MTRQTRGYMPEMDASHDIDYPTQSEYQHNPGNPGEPISYEGNQDEDEVRSTEPHRQILQEGGLGNYQRHSQCPKCKEPTFSHLPLVATGSWTRISLGDPSDQ